MRVSRAILPALLLALTGCGGNGPLDDPGRRHAADGIRPEAIEEHMAFLAGDAVEGRGTGTRGYLLAAEYVARQFEQAGLKAAGENGGFYQRVPLASTELLAAESALILHRDGEDDRRLELETDYVMSGDFLRERGEIRAPMAYVGYGVTAPELDYDDYAGIDVEGKIVVQLRGGPPSFPHNQRAYYSTEEVKSRNAVGRGAVGVVEIFPPEIREQWSWESMVRESRMSSMRWVDEGGMPHGVFSELFVVAALGVSGEALLFDAAEESFDEAIASAAEGKARPFDLPGQLTVRTASRHQRLESPNVVGLLEGSDTGLAAEHVVLTAHLDHLGVGDPVEGDGIHNGAYDNASGAAILIEVARACAALPESPRRSLLFLAVTAEEKGLLGAEYWTHRPGVPIDTVVANVNLDMVMMLHPLRDVVAFGAEHSSMLEQVETAARAFRLGLGEDPFPEEVFFVRSDQYPFVQQGIPAIFLVSGMERADGDGLADFMEWMRATYHSPSDDMSQEFDFEAGSEFARVNFVLATLVADAEERPEWNAGDFFAEKFGAR